MSNRDIQPFQFACPQCEQRITFTIGDDKGDLEGATESLDFKWPFKEEIPFVDFISISLYISVSMLWG